MPNVITDNPAASAAVSFIAAFFGVLTAFGVQLTPAQVSALTLLLVAGLALFLILQRTMVPKTPSSTAASIQTPPPGTVLTTLAGASANGPVPESEIIASTPAPVP